MAECACRKDLWVSGRALSVWRGTVKDELASVRMGNMAAALNANFGARRPPALTMLASGIKDLDLAMPCALVAPNISGGRNGVAHALSRVVPRVTGRDPYP